jgi:hypothetical protein
VKVLACVGVTIALVACTAPGPTTSAASLARQACSVGTPIAGSTQADGTTPTFGQVADRYRQAQTFSAQAAAKDRRWEPLNSAIGTLISAWSAEADAMGPDAHTVDHPIYGPAESARYNAAYNEWSDRASQAGDTFGSECAVAKAA